MKYLLGELPKQQRVYTKNDIGDKILGFHEQPLPDFSDLDMGKYPYHGATALADEIIKSRVSLYYDAYFRVDEASSDIRNSSHCRRGGMYRVRLGVERGSHRILAEMNKQITFPQIKAAVSALAYADIKTTTYWVICHPGETEEDFQQILDLVEVLKEDTFQIECNYFLPHYTKQFSEEEWRKNVRLLYPESASNMLVFQYYTLAPGMEPSREETFKRVHRFEVHSRKLGIPNPYY